MVEMLLSNEAYARGDKCGYQRAEFSVVFVLFSDWIIRIGNSSGKAVCLRELANSTCSSDC